MRPVTEALAISVVQPQPARRRPLRARRSTSYGACLGAAEAQEAWPGRDFGEGDDGLASRSRVGQVDDSTRGVAQRQNHREVLLLLRPVHGAQHLAPSSSVQSASLGFGPRPVQAMRAHRPACTYNDSKHQLPSSGKSKDMQG